MLNKKVTYLLAVAVFLLSAYSSYSYFHGGKSPLVSPLSNYKAPQNGANSELVDNEPKTEECPINGMMLSKAQRAKWEKRRPMGVMIENHLEARPQSGLSSADVVYEAVAEGGITRFMGVFYCRDAKMIGPVRSARIYFIRLLQGYGNNPLYAHVGGANCDAETGSGCANGAKADALGTINKMGWGLYNDLNQFGVPFPYYWRDYERLPGVATEHTVYSSTDKLWNFAASKRGLTEKDEEGTMWNTTFTPWKFQDEAASGKRGSVNKIAFSFWNSFESDYSVNWNYNKETNTYSRVNGGKPHLDKNTGKQLTAKNVAIVFADESPANDGYEGGHILYDLTGSGDALVFQNGDVIKGTWEKASPEDQIVFKDSSGKEAEFVRGQIWVEIQPAGNKVTY